MMDSPRMLPTRGVACILSRALTNLRGLCLRLKLADELGRGSLLVVICCATRSRFDVFLRGHAPLIIARIYLERGQLDSTPAFQGAVTRVAHGRGVTACRQSVASLRVHRHRSDPCVVPQHRENVLWPDGHGLVLRFIKADP